MVGSTDLRGDNIGYKNLSGESNSGNSETARDWKSY
jgi:hypothetical protein